MLDKEKIIKAIECCIINNTRCFDNNDKLCPYFSTKVYMCEIQLLKDALALLKEQEAAYQGAEDLLQQKTILFDDAIKRLKEQEERIKMLEHQLETITKWRANAGAFD